MGDVAVLPEGNLPPLKEESPAGTGLSELPIFSGARGSAQSTPASTLTNGSNPVSTKPESDMLLISASAAAATIASGAILSDTLPTTPPYNSESTPPPQYIDDTDYVSRHVAAAVAADTPTATPPEDEYMNDAGSNAESECPALDDESPYDALYRDGELADDVPSFTQQAAKSTPQLEAQSARLATPTASGEVDVEMVDAAAQPQPSETRTTRRSLANGSRANELVTPAESSTPSSSQSEHGDSSQATPSEDNIATRRPMRMARLSRGAAPESPKATRQAAKPASNSSESASGPAPAAEDEAATAATETSAVPERRASRRVSLAAAAAAAASPLVKQATTTAARQASKASPKPKEKNSTPAKATKEATPPPVERRATRRSGLPTDLSIAKPSPEAASSSSKRRRRESAMPDPEDLPRELRRLQDTKEYSHVDEEPIVYTVWSNGRYVPANANGEPLVDKNAAKKAKAAEAAAAAEKKKAEEAAAAAAAAEAEKAAAEAALPKKRVKKWMVQGLYAGMPTPKNPTAGLTPAERKAFHKLPELSKEYPPNKTLPMPIYNGLRTLIEGRDFKMPFDVFNPLPPGQPKPVKYGRFSKNRFVGEAHAIWKKNPNYDDFQSKCVCKPETGCDEDCQNRIMLYECNDEICNVGSERCSNREFQRLADRTASKNPYHIGVEVFKTLDRGHGIRASRGFRPGQIIMEYIGEIITEEESDRRMNELYKDNACYYLMSFDQSLIIDGTSGSIARFVNHSCSPNCRMIKWIVHGQPRIALFAGDRPISTGEELTYDYNFDPYSAKNVQGCLCGADNCRGVLGPRKSEKAVSKAAAEKAAAEKAGQKAKGGNGSAKRKHDAYSMDDESDNNAAGPASKKAKVDIPVKSPAKKPVKAPPPKKVIMTTKAALEALAANAARIARLTKASHAARDARIAKAKAKREAEEAAARKAKRAKAGKAAATKAGASKAGASKVSATKAASSKPVKVVKAAKSVKVVKTSKGLKASKTSVTKEVKTATKTTKSTKTTTQVAKSSARKPASPAKNAKSSKSSKASPKKRAATPPTDDDDIDVQPTTPQSTHKATPMAQAVAKAAKAAAAKAANAAGKTTASKTAASKAVTSKTSSNNSTQNKPKSPAKSPAKSPKRIVVKTRPVVTAKKTDVTTTTTTTTTVTTTSNETPVRRGRGRPRLSTKEAISAEAFYDIVDDAAGETSNAIDHASEEVDEEEELAAQLAATEAAASSAVADADAMDITDDGWADATELTETAETPEKPKRIRKMTKAQKLRAKRQLVAARRLAARQDGSYVPKRGPGRPRKYVKISELQADSADTTMTDAPSPAPTPAAPAPTTTTVTTTTGTALAPSSAPRTKARIEYGVARRADVEEFKAARALEKARLERELANGNGTADNDENRAPVDLDTTSSPLARINGSAHDVIHVAPGSLPQPV